MIHKRGDSPIFDLFPLKWRKKSCLDELKFCEVSENPKSSICWNFHLSISKTGESPLLSISVFPITHPLFKQCQDKYWNKMLFYLFWSEKALSIYFRFVFYLSQTLQYACTIQHINLHDIIRQPGEDWWNTSVLASKDFDQEIRK